MGVGGSKKEKPVKVVIVGDSGVGKSSMVVVLVTGTPFSEIDYVALEMVDRVNHYEMEDGRVVVVCGLFL